MVIFFFNYFFLMALKILKIILAFAFIESPAFQCVLQG